MLTSSEIRQQFLDFFKSKGHEIVPSAPIVVKNDPTLLFTNAGMNQFKDYFLGNKKPSNSRIANTQKCLRVSGKHNDLEEVGVDTYHHTMFEMLGNWSFGDYFKAEAIAWSWELLTEVYKLDKSRLYVSVFEGDEKEGLPASETALKEWQKLVAPEHIIFGKKKDNFWEMGDTGPCGPCSEIHVDMRSDEERAKTPGKDLVNKDHPQVIEIWNNVFIQYNRKKDGTLEPLPAKHVDTGMGLERLVRVLQGKTSNYDTDVFTGTITTTENIVGKKYDYSDSKQAIAFRVIADHIRSIAFTIADGQLPSNTGAGYVIRRILRRAVRYYYSYLDYKQPLLHQLMPTLAKQFEHVFPELFAQLDFVSKVVKEEEDAFLRTLEKGLKRFEEYFNSKEQEIGNEIRQQFPEIKEYNFWTVPSDKRENYFKRLSIINSEKETRLQSLVFDGNFAFELYDTFGFPIDLTKLILSQNNYGWPFILDEAGYEAALKEQKERSRAATAIDTEDWITVNDITTNKFVGYNEVSVETKIIKYRKVKAKGNEFYQIVLAETPFYAESGGQVGDSGSIVIDKKILIVFDTKKENDLIVHYTKELPNDVDLTTTVTAKVDAPKRLNIAYNHTATHLLHAALRKVLGTHVAQKGSLVNDDSLRFDFSHFAKVTDEELQEIEQIVNEKIRENIPVVIKQMPKDEAMQLGAMALFGEKYGDVVRVVIIDPNYSVELCGGTHVLQTGMLGIMKITTETAVAAGVRRIEALTGGKAINYLNQQYNSVKEISTLLKTKDPLKTIEKLIVEKQALEKKLEGLEAKQLHNLSNQLLSQIESIGQVNFIGKIVTVNSGDALKKLCLLLQNELKGSGVIVLATNIDGKASVAIGIDDEFVKGKNLDASIIIKQQVAPLIKGGGGGSKNLATAGGQDASQLNAVINKVKSLF